MLRLVPIYIAILFLSLQTGTVLYINSSRLGNFFEPNVVSLLYLLGALGTITLFFFMPTIIERWGKRSILILALLLIAVALLSLGSAQTASIAIISFLIYSSVLLVINYLMDIFLEEKSYDSRTGEIRGLYFTFLSLGVALGPLMLSIFAKDDATGLVYIAASLLLIPTILLAIFNLKSPTPKWHGLHPNHMFLPLRTWWQAKDIRRITLAKLTLQFFFALMVIYTPLYLHGELGFEWSELGIIFTVMLLPFVLLEWPAGELADRLWGEKEMMSIGFLIIIASLLVMPFLGKVFILWMFILFTSRVGASLLEIMTESYFFKHISAHDIRLISIFRLTGPVSIVLAAIVSAVSLHLFSFNKIFFVLAVIVFLGMIQSLSLKDTR